jgi:hypothetical protein
VSSTLWLNWLLFGSTINGKSEEVSVARNLSLQLWIVMVIQLNAQPCFVTSMPFVEDFLTRERQLDQLWFAKDFHGVIILSLFNLLTSILECSQLHCEY